VCVARVGDCAGMGDREGNEGARTFRVFSPAFVCSPQILHVAAWSLSLPWMHARAMVGVVADPDPPAKTGSVGSLAGVASGAITWGGRRGVVGMLVQRHPQGWMVSPRSLQSPLHLMGQAMWWE